MIDLWLCILRVAVLSLRALRCVHLSEYDKLHATQIGNEEEDCSGGTLNLEPIFPRGGSAITFDRSETGDQWRRVFLSPSENLRAFQLGAVRGILCDVTSRRLVSTCFGLITPYRFHQRQMDVHFALKLSRAS